MTWTQSFGSDRSLDVAPPLWQSCNHFPEGHSLLNTDYATGIQMYQVIWASFIVSQYFKSNYKLLTGGAVQAVWNSDYVKSTIQKSKMIIQDVYLNVGFVGYLITLFMCVCLCVFHCTLLVSVQWLLLTLTPSVSLDHKTSQFSEIGIYTSSKGWIHKLSINVWFVRIWQY